MYHISGMHTNDHHPLTPTVWIIRTHFSFSAAVFCDCSSLISKADRTIFTAMLQDRPGNPLNSAHRSGATMQLLHAEFLRSRSCSLQEYRRFKLHASDWQPLQEIPYGFFPDIKIRQSYNCLTNLLYHIQLFRSIRNIDNFPGAFSLRSSLEKQAKIVYSIDRKKERIPSCSRIVKETQ